MAVAAARHPYINITPLRDKQPSKLTVSQASVDELYTLLTTKQLPASPLTLTLLGQKKIIGRTDDKQVTFTSSTIPGEYIVGTNHEGLKITLSGGKATISFARLKDITGDPQKYIDALTLQLNQLNDLPPPPLPAAVAIVPAAPAPVAAPVVAAPVPAPAPASAEISLLKQQFKSLPFELQRKVAQEFKSSPQKLQFRPHQYTAMLLIITEAKKFQEEVESQLSTTPITIQKQNKYGKTSPVKIEIGKGFQEAAYRLFNTTPAIATAELKAYLGFCNSLTETLIQTDHFSLTHPSIGFYLGKIHEAFQHSRTALSFTEFYKILGKELNGYLRSEGKGNFNFGEFFTALTTALQKADPGIQKKDCAVIALQAAKIGKLARLLDFRFVPRQLLDAELSRVSDQQLKGVTTDSHEEELSGKKMNNHQKGVGLLIKLLSDFMNEPTITDRHLFLTAFDKILETGAIIASDTPTPKSRENLKEALISILEVQEDVVMSSGWYKHATVSQLTLKGNHYEFTMYNAGENTYRAGPGKYLPKSTYTFPKEQLGAFLDWFIQHSGNTEKPIDIGAFRTHCSSKNPMKQGTTFGVAPGVTLTDITDPNSEGAFPQDTGNCTVRSPLELGRVIVGSQNLKNFIGFVQGVRRHLGAHPTS